jgi:hypothetical protein
MAKFKWRGGEISGHLDIICSDYEDEDEGETRNWQEIQIHGDPAGLRSFAKLLIKIADLDQENVDDLPIGAREHYHLRPNKELGKSSIETIAGRLDAKGTGEFYKAYIEKDMKKE